MPNGNSRGARRPGSVTSYGCKSVVMLRKKCNCCLFIRCLRSNCSRGTAFDSSYFCKRLQKQVFQLKRIAIPLFLLPVFEVFCLKWVFGTMMDRKAKRAAWVTFMLSALLTTAVNAAKVEPIQVLGCTLLKAICLHILVYPFTAATAAITTRLPPSTSRGSLQRTISLGAFSQLCCVESTRHYGYHTVLTILASASVC